MTIEQEAQALEELKIKRDEAKSTYKAIDDEYKEFESRFIARMEESNVDGIKVGGTNFIPAATTYAQVQDRETFTEWAKMNDEQLIEDKPRKELLNQLVRECLDNGETLPPGIGFYVREYVSMRAS